MWEVGDDGEGMVGVGEVRDSTWCRVEGVARWG